MVPICMHQEMDRVIPRITVAAALSPAPIRPSLARSFSANCSLLPMYKIVCGGAAALRRRDR